VKHLCMIASAKELLANCLVTVETSTQKDLCPHCSGSIRIDEEYVEYSSTS
jgi:hypothetical protein